MDIRGDIFAPPGGGKILKFLPPGGENIKIFRFGCRIIILVKIYKK
jgi:hypothetical protein